MKNYKLSQIKDKRISGRNIPSAGETDKPLNLFWAASSLEIKVKATEVWCQFSSDYDNSEPWVSIYLDGAVMQRFPVLKGSIQNICLARGLDPNNEHLLTIYKDTQPMPEDSRHSLFIHSVSLNDDGLFGPVKSHALKVEVIGDSITSGEGMAGAPAAQEWVPMLFDGSRTYAVQLARLIDADLKTISQSGWGICWGWDGNRNSKIPPFYEEVCGVIPGDFQNQLGSHELYDFKGGSDLVVVNLGTNDNSGLKRDANGKADPAQCDEIITGVKDFLVKIRKNNPVAKIVWVYGMIKLDIVPGLIEKGVEEYKKSSSDSQVYTLQLDSMEDVEVLEEDKGSRGHPGPKTHRLAAEKIKSFVQNL